MAEWYWMGRQRPYCCRFESRAPHLEGGHVTVMLRGVLIGRFDPGWQVFHLSLLGVCISCSSKLPSVKQAAQCGSYAKGVHTCVTPI